MSASFGWRRTVPARRRFAVDEESRGEMRGVPQGGIDGNAALRRRDRAALASQPDGIPHQHIERQLPAEGAGEIEGQRPARHDPRDREGGIRAMGRNDFVFPLAIALDCRQRAGGAGRVQPMNPSPRLPHDEEAVAAKAVEVRQNDRAGRRHRHHGFDCVAARGQDRLADFCRACMGRRDGGCGEDRGFEHGRDPMRELRNLHVGADLGYLLSRERRMRPWPSRSASTGAT